MPQKRVVAIHDISGFGKCSLTVALPIISAGGIETCVIPTSVLSTHTGGFEGYTFLDLTGEILKIAEHWKKQGFHFDGIYTGYLGSKEQIDIVIKVIDMLKSDDTLVVVDPCMADNGRLYAGFDEDFPSQMRRLCAKADIIVPNITEACMLLSKPYKEGPYTKEYITEFLKELTILGAPNPVLTGVYFDDKRLGAACLKNGGEHFAFADRIDVLYHGTGDVFASVLVAALQNDKTIEAALQIAVNFTCRCINRTLKENPDRRYGVNFEQELPELIKYLG